MSGEIGVLIVGLKGAVATTLASAGIASRHNLTPSLTLPSEREPDFASLSLTPLSSFRFGGWDVVDASFESSLRHHRVLPDHLIDRLTPHLAEIQCFSGISLTPVPIHSEQKTHQQLDISQATARDLVDQVSADIRQFKLDRGVSEVVVIDLSSTARSLPEHARYEKLLDLEVALDLSISEVIEQGALSEGTIYAYAAIMEGCACVNFTPSMTFDIPALITLAEERGVPLCGKDGKTGQTLYKTVLAPMFRQRGLKVTGWYSTNILGNRDGEVLNHPEHRQTKLESKTGVLKEILGDDTLDHQVHIHYYRPRGDAKEAWDNIDFEGWFGVPMQMKVNWLGSDSILAAPLAADLVRWAIFFKQRGEKGIISALASYFKTPLGTQQHDFSAQVSLLNQAVAKLTSEEN